MDGEAMRSLPPADLRAVFGVVVTIHGELTAGRLDPDLTGQLLKRLSQHGPLPDDASPGELNALLAAQHGARYMGSPQ